MKILRIPFRLMAYLVAQLRDWISRNAMTCWADTDNWRNQLVWPAFFFELLDAILPEA